MPPSCLMVLENKEAQSQRSFKLTTTLLKGQTHLYTFFFLKKKNLHSCVYKIYDGTWQGFLLLLCLQY